MYILAYFCGTDGAPETGLSPTVDGYKIEDSTQVLTASALTEIGDGWYYYDYSTADSSYHYVFTIDGGAALPGLLRYAVGSSPGDSADIATVSTNVDSIATDIDNLYYKFRDMRRKNPEWQFNPAKGLGRLDKK